MPNADVGLRIRPATVGDVPCIHRLIKELADFERMSDECVCTVEDLGRELFPENAKDVEDALPVGMDCEEMKIRKGTMAIIAERRIGDDGLADTSFTSSMSDGHEVVGFALFFTSFSTFLGKHGIYLEDLYVRQAYRRQGIGRSLLRTLARMAVQQDLGRVEWSVLNWNQKAISFYESIGAKPQKEWSVYRLTADALETFGKSTGKL